jgi:hypothetical protein
MVFNNGAITPGVMKSPRSKKGQKASRFIQPKQQTNVVFDLPEIIVTEAIVTERIEPEIKEKEISFFINTEIEEEMSEEKPEEEVEEEVYVSSDEGSIYKRKKKKKKRKNFTEVFEQDQEESPSELLTDPI